MSSIICKIQYTISEKKVGWYDQTYTKTNHHVVLCTEYIETAEKSFRLNDVLDVSYRPFSDGSGLFYLHTIQGVFAYTIVEDPSPFIHMYQKIKLTLQ